MDVAFELDLSLPHAISVNGCSLNCMSRFCNFKAQGGMAGVMYFPNSRSTFRNIPLNEHYNH